MRLVADNDVRGQVAILQQVLRSPEYEELARAIDLDFVDFACIGLAPDAPDQLVWETCQREGVYLLTGNRSTKDETEALEVVLRTHATAFSLPVLTLADPQRIAIDRDYAMHVAHKLLEILWDIETLSGVRRIFLP